MTIDPLGETPVYLQLAEILRKRIRSGELQPNRPIPSLAALVQEYGVARGTAAKAVGLLVDESLVRIVPGKGAFVIMTTIYESAEQRVTEQDGLVLIELVVDADQPADSDWHVGAKCPVILDAAQPSIARVNWRGKQSRQP